MKRALVTGGAGFIGSHLVDALSYDYEITVLDNFSAGVEENLQSGEITTIYGDIKDQTTVNQAVKDQDVIFHLAAHANIRISAKDHYVDFDNNTYAMLKLLQACYENHVNDFVFASTSALVGEAKIFPTPESYLGIQESLYSASKFAGEALGQAYTRISDLKFWAFRFSNIIGPRCRRGVIWDFTNKLLKDQTRLEILGNGKQSKEYLHVTDCVKGILTGYEKSKEPVNTFNLATEENTTVDQLADIVTAKFGMNPVRQYTGGNKGWIGDLPIVHLSIEKIKALGWKPEISSKQAIEETADWSMKWLTLSRR